MKKLLCLLTGISILYCGIFTGCGNTDKKEKTSSSNSSSSSDEAADNGVDAVADISVDDKMPEAWSGFVMGDIIPVFNSDALKVDENTDEELRLDYNNISKDEYNSYVSECKNKGFTIDSSEKDDRYESYNGSGYFLTLDWDADDKELEIDLEAPVKLSAISWPVSELGKAVPPPKSVNGKCEYDDSNEFLIYIGDTSLNDFNEYITICSDAGFNIDYDKGDSYYYASNSDGIRLSISYEGFNTMSVYASNQ